LKSVKPKSELDFIEFTSSYLNDIKTQIKIETFWSYKSTISKLRKFQNKISFEELTEKFLVDFSKYMQDELKNNENTISKSLRTLRTFIIVAIRERKMTENPFSYFRIKKAEGQRDYLDLSELNKLHKHYLNLTLSNKVQKEVLLSFLFSCYTGLRYSDIRMLKIKNIKSGVIQIKTIKTNSMVTIPLSQKAIELINLEGKNLEDCLLKVYCNKVTNNNLKEICKAMGIEKKLTFHVARHTFATASLTLGIPIEVVSKLLGHTSIRTTQIYARVIDSVKLKEMKKWDKF